MNTRILFETKRLWLRPTDESDAAFMMELMNTPKWIQFVGDRNIRSVEDAKQYIQNKIQKQFESLGFSNYTIFRKSDMLKIGTVGLFDREGLDGVDIGFALLPGFEKMGYAFEAAEKMKNLGIENFGLEKIGAICTQDNFSSQKLLDKLGFVYIKNVQIPNDEEILRYYLYSK